MRITYTPLPLQDLCINIILEYFWKDKFQDIKEIHTITNLCDSFLQRFQKRHAIIKLCKM